MDRTVDVTVIVPCYNTQDYLDQALTSAEQNCSCNLEILVLNDGSTDESLRIMRAHADRDGRVRVIDKQNEGYGATVNRGIDEARGTYVAILEPDDYVLPFMYDRLFGLSRAYDTPDVIKSCYWRVIREGTNREWRAYGYLHGRVHTLGRRFSLVEEPQLIQYHPSIWSALYRRKFLMDEGIRFREVPGAGWVDNPFSVEVLAAAQSIVFTDEAYYCYREDLASASSASVDPNLMIDRWNERQDALERRGVTNEGVQRANVTAGLRFLAQMLESGALASEDVREKARSMVRRMDPALVRSVTAISPSVIAYALELAGAPQDAPSSAAYATHLAREACWALRYNGPAFLVHNLMLARKR